MVVYAKNKNYFLINFREAQRIAKLSSILYRIYII